MKNETFEKIIDVAWHLDNHYGNKAKDIIQFPQIWESTALGFGGCGGCIMTKDITTIVFINGLYDADVWFGRHMAYTIHHPNTRFYKDLAARSMKHVDESYKYEFEE